MKNTKVLTTLFLTLAFTLISLPGFAAPHPWEKLQGWYDLSSLVMNGEQKTLAPAGEFNSSVLDLTHDPGESWTNQSTGKLALHLNFTFMNVEQAGRAFSFPIFYEVGTFTSEADGSQTYDDSLGHTFCDVGVCYTVQNHMNVKTNGTELQITGSISAVDVAGHEPKLDYAYSAKMARRP